MNYWLIAGVILSVLAAITMGIGTVIQHRQDSARDMTQSAFQVAAKDSFRQIMETNEDTLASSKRIEGSIGISIEPEVLLTSVRSDWSRKLYVFQLENVGNSTADVVDLLLDYSLPGGHGNLIRTKQFTKGKKDKITYEMFPHYSRIVGSSADGLVKWKKEYDAYIEKFKAGERALIVHITLTYRWGEDRSETEKYSLVHSRDRIYLSKDTKDFPLPNITQNMSKTDNKANSADAKNHAAD